MSFDWMNLGVGEDGLPEHLPMPVTADGQGPATIGEDAHHLECWCIDPQCPLTRAFQEAWDLGLAEGAKGRTRQNVV